MWKLQYRGLEEGVNFRMNGMEEKKYRRTDSEA